MLSKCSLFLQSLLWLVVCLFGLSGVIIAKSPELHSGGPVSQANFIRQELEHMGWSCIHSQSGDFTCQSPGKLETLPKVQIIGTVKE